MCSRPEYGSNYDFFCSSSAVGYEMYAFKKMTYIPSYVLVCCAIMFGARIRSCRGSLLFFSKYFYWKNTIAIDGSLSNINGWRDAHQKAISIEITFLWNWQAKSIRFGSSMQKIVLFWQGKVQVHTILIHYFGLQIWGVQIANTFKILYLKKICCIMIRSYYSDVRDTICRMQTFSSMSNHTKSKRFVFLSGVHHNSQWHFNLTYNWGKGGHLPT